MAVTASQLISKGAKLSDEGEHWISDIDNNVWKPGVYGWSKYPKDA